MKEVIIKNHGIRKEIICDGVSMNLKEVVSAYIHIDAEGIKLSVNHLDMGNVSDGYHTFNELYHHRALLFSVICNANKSIAWKSLKHHDGTMYNNMFIVGINTPNGQATYHYDVEPYWDMFKVKELECAPAWDGHTSDDAISRIAKLGE